MWPSIDGDGPLLFPAAVEFARGHGLNNPVWLSPLNETVDGVGGRRYIYHGFLYQVLIGRSANLFGSQPFGAVRAAYFVHWLGATLAALAILSWNRTRGRWSVALGALVPPAVLAFSVAWHGRMEPLGLLLVSLGCLAWRLKSTGKRWGAAGAVAAALTFTSPACVIVSALALLIALLCERQQSRLRAAIAAAVGALSAAAFALALYPHPVSDWVVGVVRHGRLVLSLAPYQGFKATWLLRPDLPLLVVSFGLLVISAAVRVHQVLGTETRSRGAGWTLAIGFGVVIWRLAFVKSEAAYNAVVWIPLLACLAVSVHHARWAIPAVALALMFPLAGLGRNVLILLMLGRSTATFSEVRAAIASVPTSEVAVSSGLWLAADDLQRVAVVPVDAPARRIFVLQQAYTGRGTPPAQSGYRLLSNHFSPGLSVFGIPLSRTGGGWSYAIFERTRP